MDFKFTKRKNGKDKAKKTHDLYGDHSAKHVRIQEQCRENHQKKEEQEQEQVDKNSNKGKGKGKGKGKK
jgi:hypothetical protein